MKEIKILGTGCQKCEKMYKLTRQAVSEIDLECRVEKITDIQQIITYGVMITPALVVDGVVKVSGKVPSKSDIKEILL
jgi:small redox-active disulfide protein 2